MSRTSHTVHYSYVYSIDLCDYRSRIARAGIKRTIQFKSVRLKDDQPAITSTRRLFMIAIAEGSLTTGDNHKVVSIGASKRHAECTVSEV